MKKRPSIFCVTLTFLTFTTALLGARSESVSGKGEDNPVQPAAASEPAAEPSAKANGIKKSAQPARLSFGVEEVVKMHQSGVESDVILNYIENSSVPYHLSAEEIVRLHDMGVPSPIITTLIRHGAKMQQQAAAASAQMQQKATEEAKAASANYNPYSPSVYVAPPVTYAYSYPTYVNTAYPAYYYPSYYYSYPRYCYSSPFYFSFSYPGYRHFYGGFRSFPRFGFGGHIGFGGHAGFGRVGFGGGFHNGRHR